MADYFNPFLAYEQCKQVYKFFIDSYHKFTNPEIKKWIQKNTKEGHLLWREPFLQLSRPYLKGESLKSLVDKDLLEKECLKIFRTEIDDKQSPPVVSECLKMKNQGIKGIKAVFVYPMNALANSQYEDFASGLEDTGLTIALYTGDTPYSQEDALKEFEILRGMI